MMPDIRIRPLVARQPTLPAWFHLPLRPRPPPASLGARKGAACFVPRWPLPETGAGEEL